MQKPVRIVPTLKPPASAAPKSSTTTTELRRSIGGVLRCRVLGQPELSDFCTKRGQTDRQTDGERPADDFVKFRLEKINEATFARRNKTVCHPTRALTMDTNVRA